MTGYRAASLRRIAAKNNNTIDKAIVLRHNSHETNVENLVKMALFKAKRKGCVMTNLNDSLEERLLSSGFTFKEYNDGTDVFLSKVVKKQEGDLVTFNIVEYCLLRNKHLPDHCGKLQIIYGEPEPYESEERNNEIMQSDDIEMVDFASKIDPYSEDGRKLLEYAGVKLPTGDI